jgi:hypothetical protein
MFVCQGFKVRNFATMADICLSEKRSDEESLRTHQTLAISFSLEMAIPYMLAIYKI